MRKNLFVPFIILLWITGCSRHRPANPQDLPEIAGCWRGRQISKFDRPFSELLLFSLRSDGSLALSLIFEIGPRSRVWTLDTDVDVREGTIRWDDQEGFLTEDKDTMKVGQLFLNDGLWNGKRIVSEQWVRESTRERLRFGRSNRWGYGYHWMQAESRIRNRTIRSYFAPGDGNQIVAVFPDLAIVVVFIAGNYGKDPKSIYFSIFEEFILPAAMPEQNSL